MADVKLDEHTVINLPTVFTIVTLLVGLSFWVGSSAVQIVNLDKEQEKNKRSLEEYRRERLDSDRISNERITSMQIEIARLNSTLAQFISRLDRVRGD